jgi:hypothetical protein
MCCPFRHLTLCLRDILLIINTLIKMCVCVRARACARLRLTCLNPGFWYHQNSLTDLGSATYLMNPWQFLFRSPNSEFGMSELIFCPFIPRWILSDWRVRKKKQSSFIFCGRGKQNLFYAYCLLVLNNLQRFAYLNWRIMLTFLFFRLPYECYWHHIYWTDDRKLTDWLTDRSTN